MLTEVSRCGHLLEAGTTASSGGTNQKQAYHTFLPQQGWGGQGTGRTRDRGPVAIQFVYTYSEIHAQSIWKYIKDTLTIRGTWRNFSKNTKMMMRLPGWAGGPAQPWLQYRQGFSHMFLSKPCRTWPRRKFSRTKRKKKKTMMVPGWAGAQA